MVDNAPANAPRAPGSGTVITTPRRGPGHRGQDIRDTVAEMAQRAQEISMEAGSKMASAMRDVVGAAAGLSAFAIESARDLIQYMVRRGQMTQEEADKLIRDVEEAQSKGGRKAPSSGSRPPAPKSPARPAAHAKPAKKPAAKKPAAKKPAAKKTAAKAKRR